MVDGHDALRAILAIRAGSATARDWSDLRHLAMALSGRDEDIAQDTMLRVRRAADCFRGATAGEAYQWLRTMVRRARIDSFRSIARSPENRLVEVRDDYVHEDRLRSSLAHQRVIVPVTQGGCRDNRALLSLRDVVLVHVAGPSSTYALAAWARVVHGFDTSEVRDLTGAPSDAAAWKWVERGRSRVLAAIELAEDLGHIGEDVAALLRALFSERRADYGQARPERRKERVA